MGTIVSKIADEIRLHGSWEAYLEWEANFRKPQYICQDSTNQANDQTVHNISPLGTD